MAAAKSPQLSEADAEKIASNRSVASDVLGIIGHNPEFLKRYTIKKSLVAIAERLARHADVFDDLGPDLLALEVAHQPLWIGGSVQHDLLLFVGLNPLQLVNRLVGLQARL